jgi:hypothetical protein
MFTTDGTGKISSQLQSKNCQIPLKFVIGKEDTAIYCEFKDLMEQVAAFKGFKIGKEKDERSTHTFLFMLFVLTLVFLHGKVLESGKGGTCKISSYYCSCCLTHYGDNVVVQKVNPGLCEHWCQMQHSNKPGWSCYHKEFITAEVVSRQETESENLLNEMINARLQKQETWLPKCKLGHTDDPRAHNLITERPNLYSF